MGFAKGLESMWGASYPITLYPPWLKCTGHIFTQGHTQRGASPVRSCPGWTTGAENYVRTHVRTYMRMYVGKCTLLGRVQRGDEIRRGESGSSKVPVHLFTAWLMCACTCVSACVCMSV